MMLFWVGFGSRQRSVGNWTTIMLRLAVIVTVFGFIGARLTIPRTEQVLEPGQTLTIANYRIAYRGLQIEPFQGSSRKYTAWLEIGHGTEHFLANAELIHNPITNQNLSHTRIRSQRTEELRIYFQQYRGEGRVFLKVRILQQMHLVWLGGLLLLASTTWELLALLKSRPLSVTAHRTADGWES